MCNSKTVSMKKAFMILMILTSFEVFCQGIKEKLININSVEDANKFAQENKNYHLELMTLTPEIDDDESAKDFLDAEPGEIFEDNDSAYKILSYTNKRASRVSYIYLDGSKLLIKEIEKLRTKILAEYNSKKDFRSLAKKYNMDSNQNEGDLGWFVQGIMAPEFENGISAHKLNEIFKIDIPERKWYYVVLKTFNDKEVKEFTILGIKSST